MESTLPSVSPASCAYWVGAVPCVLESPRTRVLYQSRVIGDGVADRADPAAIAAGADDQRQHPRRGVGRVDLDLDCVGSAEAVMVAVPSSGIARYCGDSVTWVVLIF